MPAEHEVAIYVAENSGSLSVMDHAVSVKWGLSEVHPITRLGGLGGTVGVSPADELYPFHAHAFIGVPKVITAEVHGDEDHEEDRVSAGAAKEAIHFLAWLTEAMPHGLSADSHAEGEDAGGGGGGGGGGAHGGHAHARRAQTLEDHDDDHKDEDPDHQDDDHKDDDKDKTIRVHYNTASHVLELHTTSAYEALKPPSKLIIRAFFESVTINGKFAYPPPVVLNPGQSLSAGVIGAIVGSVIGLLLILGIPAAMKYREEKARVRLLQGSNAIAELSAECIAEMRLEELDYLRTIPKPNRIQKAFIKIVETLTEYRRYLPSSVLMETEDDESDCNSNLDRGVSCDASTVQSTSSRSLSNTFGATPGPRSGNLKFRLGLQKRVATVAALKFDIDGDTQGASQIAFLTLMEQVLGIGNRSKKAFVRVADMGLVYVSWNTACPSVNYAANGLDAMCNMSASLDAARPVRPYASRDSRSTVKISYRIGVSTASVYCGNVGDTSRVFVLNGPAVERAQLLMQYAEAVPGETPDEPVNRDLNGLCIVDDDTLKDKAVSYRCSRVDFVSFSNTGRRQFLWVLQGKEGVCNEEWMYELQQNEDRQGKTVAGLATLMWDAIRAKNINKLQALRQSFSEKYSQEAEPALLCGRLLTCAERVIANNDEPSYLSTFFKLQPCVQDTPEHFQ